MTDHSGPNDRFPYPDNAVVAVVAADDDPNRYKRALADAGFAGDAVGYLHGEQDAQSLDVEGERHGLKGHIIRSLQGAAGQDLADIRSHADALREGKTLVAVTVETREQAHSVGNALKQTGATPIYFYGKGTVETLAE